MGETIKQLEESIREIRALISNQEFKVKDAEKYLQIFGYVYNRITELEKSRNIWKERYIKLRDNKKAKDI